MCMCVERYNKTKKISLKIKCCFFKEEIKDIMREEFHFLLNFLFSKFSIVTRFLQHRRGIKMYFLKDVKWEKIAHLSIMILLTIFMI